MLLTRFNTAQIMIDPIRKTIKKLNLRFVGYEINDLIPYEDYINIDYNYFYPDDREKCKIE